MYRRRSVQLFNVQKPGSVSVRCVTLANANPTLRSSRAVARSFTNLVNASSRSFGLGRRMRTGGVSVELVLAPSATGILAAIKKSGSPLFSNGDSSSLLYSISTSPDGRWAMIDPKPVWVPVPTLWQRIMYYVWKICSVVVSVAACAAITFALWTFTSEYKWAMILLYPLPIFTSYKMFFLGQYNTVEQWADLRAQCAAASFAEALKIEGVYQCMTPRELRRKMMKDVVDVEALLQFSTSNGGLGTFQRAGMFSLKEIEEVSEFARSVQKVSDKYQAEKKNMDAVFGSKLEEAKQTMKYQIAKAQREYENSAELRYEREVENTYQQKASALDRKKHIKINKVRLDEHLSDKEKTAAIDRLERRYRDKADDLRSSRDSKLAYNQPARVQKSKDKEAKIREANEIYENWRERLYKQEGMGQKYDNLQKEYSKNKGAIQDKWQKYVRSVLSYNEGVAADTLEKY